MYESEKFAKVLRKAQECGADDTTAAATTMTASEYK